MATSRGVTGSRKTGTVTAAQASRPMRRSRRRGNWRIDMRRAIAGVALIVTIGTVSVAAQWPKRQAPGVPRDAQGKVRMDAPTPRMPDGKPDLSGDWIRFRGEGAFTPPELSGLFRNRPPAAQTPAAPADPNSPPIAAFWEIGAN